MRAVYICLRCEDRQISVEDNIGEGADHGLIMDDQKDLKHTFRNIEKVLRSADKRITKCELKPQS